MKDTQTQVVQQAEVTTKYNKGTNQEPKKYARLPCRGCLASCKNYDLCDGKLWRMVI